jgi:hypothetical protein
MVTDVCTYILQHGRDDVNREKILARGLLMLQQLIERISGFHCRCLLHSPTMSWCCIAHRIRPLSMLSRQHVVHRYYTTTTDSGFRLRNPSKPNNLLKFVRQKLSSSTGRCECLRWHDPLKTGTPRRALLSSSLSHRRNPAISTWKHQVTIVNRLSVSTGRASFLPNISPSMTKHSIKGNQACIPRSTLQSFIQSENAAPRCGLHASQLCPRRLRAPNNQH